MQANKRIGVLISGSGSNLQAIIDAQNAGNLNGEVVFVLSNKADAYGLERAKNAGISSCVISNKDFASREEFDAQLIAELKKQNLDLIVLAGFMRILTTDFVNAFAGKIINIHPALLPNYKGMDTHKRVLADKCQLHGCSIHFVTAELDAGSIIARALLKIDFNQTEDELIQRVHKLEHFLYPKVINWIMQERLNNKNGKLYLDDKEIPTTGVDFEFFEASNRV